MRPSVTIEDQDEWNAEADLGGPDPPRKLRRMLTRSGTLTNDSPEDARNAAVMSIAAGTRVRKSPYFRSTIAAGVSAFSVYNRMLLPSLMDTSTDEEYWALKNHVQIWDVAAERQVEITGPDAAALVNRMTPRDLSKMKVGQCKYALITDEVGIVINDPVVLKLAEDRFWVSVADSDIIYYAKGLAAGLGWDVSIFEPDVSPMAVQGPKSPAVMEDLFGPWIHELAFFDFRQTELNGIPLVLARSGWSPERGYELYLQDGSRGAELWDLVVEAGKPHQMSYGSVNQPRRLEAGMLSWGGDILRDMNALELQLPKFMVNLDKKTPFVGQDALRKIAAAGGPARCSVPITIDGERLRGAQFETWPLVLGDKIVGEVTGVGWSPGLESIIALAVVETKHSAPGTAIEVHVGDTGDDDVRTATVTTLPFPGTTNKNK